MSSKVNPYKNSTLSKKDQVTKMFDTISKEYDGLNRVISFGIDIKWRKKVVALVKENAPQRVLDIATGTGDLAIQLTETGATEIIGLDISKGMLEVGREKVAAQHLNNIYYDISKWWNSDEVQKARLYYCRSFVKMNPKIINDIYKNISKYSAS